MKSLFAVLLAIAFASCGDSNDHSQTERDDQAGIELPEEKQIEEFPQTEFISTLESKLTIGKNSIYAATLPMAFAQVREEFGGPFTYDTSNTEDFGLLNESQSYLNVLAHDEYDTETHYNEDGSFEVHTGFSIALPFEDEMHKVSGGMEFAGRKVKAFGITYHDEIALGAVRILYYEDDAHFVIQLLPRNEKHKLILAYGIDLTGNFQNLFERTQALIDSGDADLNNPARSWRCAFNPEDSLVIPCFQFNIQKTWNELQGQRFKAKDGEHTIVLAEQRTGFVLNEKGARIESEIVLTSDSIGMPDNQRHPKKMIFDQPFFMYVKRTDATHPYFAMKVETAELMAE